MTSDELNSYINHLRERSKTPREREIERELQRIAAKHRAAMVAESAPLFKELTAIEAGKPPLPIAVDGKVYEYIGPKRDV